MGGAAKAACAAARRLTGCVLARRRQGARLHHCRGERVGPISTGHAAPRPLSVPRFPVSPHPSAQAKDARAAAAEQRAEEAAAAQAEAVRARVQLHGGHPIADARPSGGRTRSRSSGAPQPRPRRRRLGKSGRTAKSASKRRARTHARTHAHTSGCMRTHVTAAGSASPHTARRGPQKRLARAEKPRPKQSLNIHGRPSLFRDH